MSILYTNTMLEPTPVAPPYVYPAHNYNGPLRFDRIDAQILWAEAESAKGAESHWWQDAWVRPMAEIDRNHADLPIEPTSPSSQGILECGTAFCLAGSAAVMAGYKPRISAEGVFDYSYMIKPGDPEPRYAKNIAMEWFGVPEIDEDRIVDELWESVSLLFKGSNDIEDIKGYRDNVAILVGFPTRWRRPETPALRNLANIAPSLSDVSDSLDSLHALGYLDLKDQTPDEVLAQMFDLNLDVIKAEQEALAAWEASN